MLLRELLSYLPYGAAAAVIFLTAQRLIGRRRIPLFTAGVTALLGLSLTAVFALTVSPFWGYSLQHLGGAVNLLPFAVLESVKGNPYNFYGNMLLFIPVGALPMLLSDRFQKLFATLTFGAGLSVFIETLQLFLPRGTDIDDVILNTAGTFWGYLLGRGILKLYPGLRRFALKGGGGRTLALALTVLLAVFAKGEALERPGEAPEFPQAAVVKAPLPQPSYHAPSLTAENVYFLEVGSVAPLYEKGADEKIAPASTAKLLTALTALDFCAPEDEVTVGREVERIAKDASRAWLAPKHRLTVRQLLYAVLLPSGNDAAYALAVYAGRRILEDDKAPADDALAAFLSAANEKSKAVGAVSSNFISPDGYDAKGQYTTARDLAKIAGAFLENDTLREIAACRRVSLVFASGQQVTYYNTNELLNPDSPYCFEEATGLKTGRSEAAGCCLVSCAKIDGKEYLCVVMGATEEGRWEDTLALYGALS